MNYCTFCGEDAVNIKNESLLACTSCGKVISFKEIEKAAIETFKAFRNDFPKVDKEPRKVRVPLFLDRHVTYLHADGKTWERVPMQLFVGSASLGSTLQTPIIRIGNNTFEIWVGHVAGDKYKRGMVRDHHIDSKKVNRKKLLEAHHGHDDKQWLSKPLYKRGEYHYNNEIKAWKEEAIKDRIALKRWRRKIKPIKLSKKEAKELREHRAKEVKESEFSLVIKPFVKRNRKKAVNVYQALSNMKWRRIKDGKVYSCSWRHAGGLVAKLRNKNEVYTDYYCSGGESDVTEEFEAYMKRKGWEKLPWD